MVVGSIDFSKVRIIKKLGSGLLGTVFLCKYKKKHYALKQEHVHPTCVALTELDVFKYINTLDADEQCFFTKCHGYELYDNCKLKQYTRKNSNMNDDLRRKNKSKWCIQYLIDYKGTTTLESILYTLTFKERVSCVLQICNIMFIFDKGGYSHNDLHFENIMVQRTSRHNFNLLNGRKFLVPYFNLQLCAIDYGEALHNSFQEDYFYKYPNSHQAMFTRNHPYFLFRELKCRIHNLLFNQIGLIRDCEKRKLPLPYMSNPNIFRDGMLLITRNYFEFFKESARRYIDVVPQVRQFVEDLQGQQSSNVWNWFQTQIVPNNTEYNIYCYHLLELVQTEFGIMYPVDFMHYFGWHSDPNSFLLFPKELCLQFLQVRSIKECVNFFIKLL